MTVSFLPNIQLTKLKSFCATRWSEQHGAISSTIDNLPDIVEVLKLMSNSNDNHLQRDSTELLRKIRSPDIIFPMFCARKALSQLKPLVNILQNSELDIKAAFKQMELVKLSLVMTMNSEKQFSTLYSQSKELSEKIEAYSNRDSLINNSSYVLELKSIFKDFYRNIVDDLEQRLNRNERAMKNLS